MLNQFLVFITNLFYFVPVGVNNFKKKFPNAKVIIACAVKGRKLQRDEDPQYNYGWSLARRSTLILAESGLYCGDWEIPLHSIHDATLYRISLGNVLRIKTADGLHYQFGMQADRKWENQKIIPLKIEDQGIGFSTPALVVRIIVTLWLIYFIFQEFMQQNLSIVTVFEILLVFYLIGPIISWILKRF